MIKPLPAKSATDAASEGEGDEMHETPPWEVMQIPEITVEEMEIKPKLMLTADQEMDIRKAFNLLDYTGEGKILNDDFRIVIKALGFEATKEELLLMVNEVDTNYSGKLSFENFRTALLRKVGAVDTKEELFKSFLLIDRQDSGYITFDDLKYVTQILETNLVDEEIEEMLDEADGEEDNQISLEEFMKMMKHAVKLSTP